MYFTILKVIFFKWFLLILHFRLPLMGASLVAQLVKNPPAMQETSVRFLGWEDSLEEG